MSTFKNNSKDITLTRYDFYANYNNDAYDYCPIIYTDRSLFRDVYYKLLCLGESEDFLTVLQQQSEPTAEYCKLIDLIGFMMEDGQVELLVAKELNNSLKEVRDYTEESIDYVLCDIASLIPKVKQSIVSLTSEIESELGLPIAAINLIISSLLDTASPNFSHSTRLL